jgi:hypothetical protein
MATEKRWGRVVGTGILTEIMMMGAMQAAAAFAVAAPSS